MRNKNMERMLGNGEALDVRKFGEALGDGTFRIHGYVEGAVYCDPVDELWIYSIGMHKRTGEIQASVTSRFYEDSEYNCLQAVPGGGVGS